MEIPPPLDELDWLEEQLEKPRYPTLLRGGPHDGKVADTSGSYPVFILTEPRFFVDDAESARRVAHWDGSCHWYVLGREAE